ncbi:MAG: hypothetical protein FWC43_05005 [Planctomycetaceae bacterium]|nr:hypothetical protein [Planctomycetaceae bacterium]
MGKFFRLSRGGRWQTADGRRQTTDGRRQTADGRRQRNSRFPIPDLPKRHHSD